MEFKYFGKETLEALLAKLKVAFEAKADQSDLETLEETVNALPDSSDFEELEGKFDDYAKKDGSTATNPWHHLSMGIADDGIKFNGLDSPKDLQDVLTSLSDKYRVSTTSLPYPIGQAIFTGISGYALIPLDKIIEGWNNKDQSYNIEPGALSYNYMLYYIGNNTYLIVSCDECRIAITSFKGSWSKMTEIGSVSEADLAELEEKIEALPDSSDLDLKADKTALEDYAKKDGSNVLDAYWYGLISKGAKYLNPYYKESLPHLDNGVAGARDDIDFFLSKYVEDLTYTTGNAIFTFTPTELSATDMDIFHSAVSNPGQKLNGHIIAYILEGSKDNKNATVLFIDPDTSRMWISQKKNSVWQQAVEIGASQLSSLETKLTTEINKKVDTSDLEEYALKNGTNAIGIWNNSAVALDGGEYLRFPTDTLAAFQDRLLTWLTEYTMTGAEFMHNWTELPEAWIDAWNNGTFTGLSSGNTRKFGLQKLLSHLTTGQNRKSGIRVILISCAEGTKSGLYYVTYDENGGGWSKIAKIASTAELSSFDTKFTAEINKKANTSDLGNYALKDGTNATGDWYEINSGGITQSLIGAQVSTLEIAKEFLDSAVKIKDGSSIQKFKILNTTFGNDFIEAWNNSIDTGNSDIILNSDHSITSYLLFGSSNGQSGAILFVDTSINCLWTLFKKGNKWGKITKIGSSTDIENLSSQIEQKVDSSDLAQVAKTGKYTDLTSTPTISTNISTDSTSDEKIASPKAVYDFVNSKVSSVYKPAGTKTLETLPTPTAAELGNVYNISKEFTTTVSFVEGTGHKYPAGTNVVCIDNGSEDYLWDVLSGVVDLSNYAQANDFEEITADEVGAEWDKIFD